MTVVTIKDLKESNPVEIAEFITARGIADEPAFNWWVPWTLKKSERIIALIISRLKITTHKYGFEIPTSKKHVKRLDEENGNILWWDALSRK